MPMAADIFKIILVDNPIKLSLGEIPQ